MLMRPHCLLEISLRHFVSPNKLSVTLAVTIVQPPHPQETRALNAWGCVANASAETELHNCTI